MVVESFHLLDSSSDSDSSEQSTSTTGSSDKSSSNYMDQNRESSAAQTDNLKELIDTLTRGRNIKGLTRMCSSKYRRKGAKVPNYLKATKCSVVRKLNLQASSPNLNAAAASPRNKPLTVLRRTATLRPKRRLAKLVSLRPRRPSMKNCSEVSPSMGSGVQRATCSSVYKNSKFPAQIDIQPGDDVSVISPAAKVCTFSYCSLHGHRHTASPSLKRLKSARQRVRTQRSKKLGELGLLLHNSIKDVGEKENATNESRHRSPIGSAESTGQPDASRSKGEIPRAISALSADGEEMMDKLQCVDEVSHNDPASRTEKSSSAETAIVVEERAADGNGTGDDSVKASFESHKLNGLWNLLYHHMASDVAENGGLESPLNPSEMSWLASPDEADQKELRESDAVKMLQEAVNKILAQTQNSSFENSKESSAITPNLDEEKLKPVKDAAKKPNQLASKRWSSLKSYVLMRRFIKAMEKMRTFSPRTPWTLSSAEYPEHEKVSLRSRSMEERKGTEEFMLDYALRKVISGLEPAQKRKVALLVRAFETMNPVPGSGSRLRPTGSFSSLSIDSQVSMESSSVDGDTGEESIVSSTDCQGEISDIVEAAEELRDENNSNGDSVKASFGRRKLTGLWRLIHQQVLSDVAENGELEFPVHRLSTKEEEKEDGYDWAATHDEAGQQEELRETDAIKLLRDAITRILAQSQTCSSSEGTISPDVEEQQLSVDKTPNINKKPIIDAGKKPNPLVSKRWSNVKKHVMMRRFITVMEKMRTFNPRIPRSISSEEYREQERVSLRRQSIEGRKNSEEWMLDYALRKVISELEPAQKRKVALLVHAFETLNPVPGSGSRLKPTGSYASISEGISEDIGMENGVVSKDVEEDHGNVYIASNTNNGGYLEEVKQVVEIVQGFRDEEGQGKDQAESSGDSVKASLGSRKFSGLWYMIHQQMVSEVAENGGLASPVSQVSIKEPEEDIKKLPETNGSGYNSATSETSGATTPEEAIQQSDVIKLLREAVDKILAQTEKHSFVRQTSNGGMSEEMVTGESTAKGMKPVKDAGRMSPNQLVSQRWSNVKKYVLMRRFIKAMEKTRTFRPRIPRSPSSEVYTEQEKVSLRSQFIGERKNSEEWMLDYALRKVISELDPPQQRKVGLLVQAFEKFSPFPGSKAQIKPSVQNVAETGIENGDSTKTGLITETQHEGGEESGSHPSAAAGDGPGSGIKKEDGLWSLIYKRMSSSLESEGATQPPLPIFDGDKEGMESEGITQSKLEAIKLVQQAIDEILLPDNADSSVDDQDTAKGTIQEKGPENKGCSKEARDLSIGENINDQCVQSTPDSRLESYGVAKLEGNAENHQEGKSVTPAGKSWNNLKKAILLKRFVKALEKVRTFNPQQPRHLPLEPDEDPERVNLRRQDSEDRKNGEVYLLDYALQQVVSKLTPARKKKVHLLVEAFETITPHLGK